MFVLFTYYAWFWQKSGQTLGMRVWKIRIVTESGANPGWIVCYQRLGLRVIVVACVSGLVTCGVSSDPIPGTTASATRALSG